MDLLDLAGGPVRPPLVDLTPDELALLRPLVPGFQRWRAR
jgi:hypothetical protein